MEGKRFSSAGRVSQPDLPGRQVVGRGEQHVQHGLANIRGLIYKLNINLVPTTELALNTSRKESFGGAGQVLPAVATPPVLDRHPHVYSLRGPHIRCLRLTSGTAHAAGAKRDGHVRRSLRRAGGADAGVKPSDLWSVVPGPGDISSRGLAERLLLDGRVFHAHVPGVLCQNSPRVQVADLENTQNIAVSIALPAVVVALVVAVSYVQSKGESIGYSSESCFLSSQLLVGTAMVLPLSVIVVLNLVLFLLTLRRIHEVKKLKPHSDSRQETHQHVWVCARLSMLTGVMWTLSLLSEGLDLDWLRGLSILANGGQGVLLLMSYVTTRRVRICCTHVLDTIVTSRRTHSRQPTNSRQPLCLLFTTWSKNRSLKSIFRLLFGHP
ncbi:hypothetical protein C0Q70_00086 [Pomacea canaliculata]|uniref:G-protein coupled receptors family 2 profile 2 domain-containing protein n=1 Tax=Pomacea canaliculata TaxID=400727 RepID=A0A2T7PVN8_POMCA|nr:hypothetical protein C0Q70_00086 [Pomacea canaliculata]